MIDPQLEQQQGDEVVLAGLRNKTPNQRLAIACRLTAMVRASSRRAWRARHPELSQTDSDLAWASAIYGDHIAACLRRHRQRSP